MRASPLMVCVSLLVGAAAPAGGAHWPQWRGPAFNGSTPETGLPETWGPEQNVAWVAPLPGPGAATPVVWRDRVFLTATSGDVVISLWALCLDARDGRVLWKKRTGISFHMAHKNTVAAPSPVTDGLRVIFCFGNGRLVAYSLDGRRLWRRNLPADYGKFIYNFVYSASPLLFDGRLFVPVIHGGPSYVLCLDPATGQELWKQERETGARGENRQSYVTPYPLRTPRGNSIVIPGADFVSAYDPRSGTELWRSDSFNPNGKPAFRTVASAVGLGDTVFVCASRGSALIALPGNRRGPLAAEDRLWTLDRPSSDVCSPLVYEGRLYVLAGEHKVITCLDPLTAKPKWRGRLKSRAAFYASPVAGDGKIYCLNLNGEVFVLRAGDSFQVLNRVAMGDAADGSSIVIAGGRLYIRTRTRLFCVKTAP